MPRPDVWTDGPDVIVNWPDGRRDALTPSAAMRLARKLYLDLKAAATEARKELAEAS